MTCVAVSVKHLTLATDSRCSSEGGMCEVIKAKRVGKGIVGAAGDWDDVLKFWDVLEGKPPKDAVLRNDAELEGIELHPDGIFLYTASGKRFAIRDQFYAIGSGGPYAIGAMAMGATPAEAVALASRFDPATGGQIETHQLKAVNGSNIKNKRR